LWSFVARIDLLGPFAGFAGGLWSSVATIDAIGLFAGSR
jgi:hypothetical protein